MYTNVYMYIVVSFIVATSASKSKAVHLRFSDMISVSSLQHVFVPATDMTWHLTLNTVVLTLLPRAWFVIEVAAAMLHERCTVSYTCSLNDSLCTPHLCELLLPGVTDDLTAWWWQLIRLDHSGAKQILPYCHNVTSPTAMLWIQCLVTSGPLCMKLSEKWSILNENLLYLSPF